MQSTFPIDFDRYINAAETDIADETLVRARHVSIAFVPCPAAPQSIRRCHSLTHAAAMCSSSPQSDSSAAWTFGVLLITLKHGCDKADTGKVYEDKHTEV